MSVPSLVIVPEVGTTNQTSRPAITQLQRATVSDLNIAARTAGSSQNELSCSQLFKRS